MMRVRVRAYLAMAFVISASWSVCRAQEDKIAPKVPHNQKLAYQHLTSRELTYSKVKDLLSERCMSCHGSSGPSVDFSNFLANEAGWVNGNLVVPRDPQGSILFRYLQGTGNSPSPFSSMPSGGSLSGAERQLFTSWISNMEEYPNTSSIGDRAHTTLRVYCSSCHGTASSGAAGINYITDVEKLVANGKIVPRTAALDSPLYAKLQTSSGHVPAGTTMPTLAELNNLKLWIETIVPPSQTISEEAVFHRCYGQLVRKRAPSTHPLLLSVQSGSMNASQACMALFDKALMPSSGTNQVRLANQNDLESKSIVRTFQTFHQTWWQEDAKLPDNIYADLRHQMSGDEHVNFLTQALLVPNQRYDSVLKDKRSIKARRTLGDWKYAVNGGYGTSKDIEQGELIGFDYYPEGSGTWRDLLGVDQSTVKYIYSPYTVWSSKRNFGGGILGLQSFIWYYNGYPFMRDTANGAVRVPRRWAKTVFQSLLCREIPLVRTSDVTVQVAEYRTRYPDPAAHVPFRPDANCMSCHAALDTMAGVLRNISFRRTDIPREAADSERQAHILMQSGGQTTALENEGMHLVQPDTNFYTRPPNGKLYYRSYDGTLINEAIRANTPEEALSKLGDALANKDDLYMCAASRYLKFFTGISTNLMDYQDPRNGGVISEGDLYYRNLVKTLALGSSSSVGLKQHQSLRQLIQDIVSSPMYHRDGLRAQKIQEGQ